MRRMRRGVVAAGLAGALLSAVPGHLAAAHAASQHPGTTVPLPGPLAEPPEPVPMPEMVPPVPPPVPMPHVLPASPRLDELRPRIAMRPPLRLAPPRVR